VEPSVTYDSEEHLMQQNLAHRRWQAVRGTGGVPKEGPRR
jgi:hypothetical protein